MSELTDTFGDWMTSTVQVATNRGAGAYGPSLAAPVAVLGVMVSASRRFVRNSDGNEVVSETSILSELENVATFALGSEVTLPNGTTSTVLVAALDEHIFDALVVALA